jgi:hypothetical protein
MSNGTGKMDAYSDHMVPFDLAAWCRGRKFHPKAATLAKTLRAKEEARAAIYAAERALDLAEQEVKAAVADLAAHVEKEGT